MRGYPSFIAEIGAEKNHKKLVLGTWAGFAPVVIFVGFFAAARAQGLLGVSPWFYALMALKVLTNVVALVSLRARRSVLETGGLNVMTDLAVITGAIYLTGGPVSPLVPMYVVELAVIALLTNRGVTLMVGTLAVLAYGAMSLGVLTGALTRHATPFELAGGLTPGYVATDLCLFVILIGGPTIYISRIVRRLEDNERALEARARELVELGKHKAQFLAALTHELRTPIYGIEGLVDVLEDGVYGPVTDRQREAFAGVHQSARSLLELVDALLALARDDVRRLEPKLAPVDLREAVLGVVASARFLIGRKELELTTSLEAGLPELHTDRRMLVHVLVNLLANAIKFTPERGSIDVTVARDGERVVISVRDTGIGIPESQRAKIFHEFYQVDGSAQREHGGVGLGLALVKRLTERLGGTIEVESVEEQGSTFRLGLPIRSATERQRAETPPPTRDTSSFEIS